MEKRKLLLLVPFALAMCNANSQTTSPQLLNTTGATLKNGSVTIDYSIGEIAITTINSKNNYLTQGLLQPVKKSILTAIENGNRESASIYLYPNPVVEKISIHCPENYSASIYTSSGVKLRQMETNTFSDATDLEKGTYIVKVLDLQNATVSTLRFIKL